MHHIYYNDDDYGYYERNVHHRILHRYQFRDRLHRIHVHILNRYNGHVYVHVHGDVGGYVIRLHLFHLLRHSNDDSSNNVQGLYFGNAHGVHVRGDHDRGGHDRGGHDRGGHGRGGHDHNENSDYLYHFHLIH
ncbi:unnamed protein product [[Candida] boidinii]|nr:unnamed protein product [[Candida] boidinii]